MDDVGSIVPSVREASRRLVRELGFLDDGERTLGISHAQCHALLEIERAGACTASELAELLQLDKSTISRTVHALLEAKLARAVADPSDARRKRLVLTAAGKKRLARIHEGANTQVSRALATLSPEERETVALGLALYAKALGRQRRADEHTIRHIRPSDDPEVAALIRTVMPAFGADGPGFAIHDPEVDAMSAAYAGKRAGYWVVERERRVVGGAGFAPLTGGPDDVCELRKMYFLPETRGLGLGARLLDLVLAEAKKAGFARCYLETLDRMTDAQRLYVKKGFVPTAGPLGCTGHFGCNRFYVRDL
jgi:putative acetyltransferase